MKDETKIKVVQSIVNYLKEDVTDFELIWLYHRIFHERLPLETKVPDCTKCTILFEI